MVGAGLQMIGAVGRIIEVRRRILESGCSRIVRWKARCGGSAVRVSALCVQTFPAHQLVELVGRSDLDARRRA
jgi:hypothetical protein